MMARVGRPAPLLSRPDFGSFWNWAVSGDEELDLTDVEPVQITVTNAGTAHAKGAWVEAVASTTKAYDGIVVGVHSSNAPGTDTSRLLDIGIGAAAAEEMIVEGIDVGWDNSSISVGSERPIPLLVDIPRGSRIAFRAQGAEPSDGAPIGLLGFLSTRLRSPRALVPLGVSLTTSGGVTLPMVTSQQKEAWGELTAATPMPFRAILLQLGLPAGTTGNGNWSCMADFAVGPAGGEQVILPNRNVFSGNSEQCQGERWSLLERHIPAGTRLAARYAARISSSGLSASAIGVPY